MQFNTFFLTDKDFLFPHASKTVFGDIIASM